MADKFISQVSDWIKASPLRVEAVLKTATQSMIEEAQTPRAKAGRLPVDTGYLRNSGLAALNSMPSGVSSPANMVNYSVVINRAKMGDRIVFGWIAEYSVYMEARFAFMRSAAQNWEYHVRRAAQNVESEVRS